LNGEYQQVVGCYEGEDEGWWGVLNEGEGEEGWKGGL
jgi:hypothetical protein